MPASQVDSIWWNWGEMNYAPYASDLLPVREEYQQWLKQGLDPLPLCIAKCRERDTEAFYSFRINGANDFGDWALPDQLVEHPEWGIPSPYWPDPWRHFNFALEGWLLYSLEAAQLAHGSNAVAFRLSGRCPGEARRATVEKLEIHVCYGQALASRALRRPGRLT